MLREPVIVYRPESDWNQVTFLNTYLQIDLSKVLSYIFILTKNQLSPLLSPMKALLPCFCWQLIPAIFIRTLTFNFDTFLSFNTIDGVVTHIVEPYGCTWELMTKWGKNPGGYSINAYTGRFRPEVQPLILLYTIFSRKRYPFRISSIDKWYPFHIHVPCWELYIPFNCCKCTVF